MFRVDFYSFQAPLLCSWKVFLYSVDDCERVAGDFVIFEGEALETPLDGLIIVTL